MSSGSIFIIKSLLCGAFPPHPLMYSLISLENYWDTVEIVACDVLRESESTAAKHENKT